MIAGSQDEDREPRDGAGNRWSLPIRCAQSASGSC